ncbi:MAG: hypothetical protein WBO10_05210 [Pyrinomonadaceae bacterium]
MKNKTTTAIVILTALWLSACSSSASTGTNVSNTTANATTANTTNSAPANAANTTANTAPAPDQGETETAKKSDPASGSVRVQFKKGETSTTIPKDIPAEGSVDFLMNVQKGQTIGYTVGYDFKDSDVEAFLTEPGLQDISKTSGPKAPQEFVVKKTGDHRLTVNNTTRKKITITLYVDVE